MDTATGDGFSRRAEEAILHGCIPVIIMDNVDEKFASVIDYSDISLRFAENELELVRPGLDPLSAHTTAYTNEVSVFTIMSSHCLIAAIAVDSCAVLAMEHIAVC